MSKYLVVAVSLALAACGPKQDAAPAADTTAVTTTPPAVDTTVKPDTAKVAGDTAKKPN